MIGSWFDFGNGDMTPENDESRGKALIEYFLDEFNARYSKDLSMEDLLTGYGTIGPYLYENIGLNQRVMGLSMSAAENVMLQIINNGNGLVPKNFMDYGNAMAKSVQDFSFWEALPYVATETFKEAGKIGIEVGKGLETTLKLGRYTMPVLIYGGAAVAIWFIAKGLQGSTESVGRGLGRATESIGRGIGDRIRKR